LPSYRLRADGLMSPPLFPCYRERGRNMTC